MNPNKVMAAAVAAVVTLLLASCSPGITAADGTTTAPSAVEYNSIDDLKDAFIAAGGECSIWEHSNRISNALQSGECDSSSVLSIYGSRDAANSQAVILKNLLVEADMDVNLLLGENWLINSPQVSEMQTALGGVLLK